MVTENPKILLTSGLLRLLDDIVEIPITLVLCT